MTAAPPRRRQLRCAAAVVLAAVAVALGVVPARAASSATAIATPTACPAGFQVLHDTRIGSLALPQGAYEITATGITCPQATALFSAFLRHWDGRLPAPWRYTAQGIGSGTFIGVNSQQFSVARVTRGDAYGQQPAGDLVCAQGITLAQPDRIGALWLDRGSYTITRLDPLAPSCSEAAALLEQFLADFDGKLRNGWVPRASDRSLVRGAGAYGFRLDPGAGRAAGQLVPTRSTRCPATFRVLRRARVARMVFPAGAYWVNVAEGSRVTCRRATTLLASFLRRRAGRLPRPWILSRATGTFRRGRTSPSAFQAKPAFRVR